LRLALFFWEKIEMIKNLKLKSRIVETGLTQCAVAGKLGLREERISNFIHGRRNPTIAEKAKIAAFLGCSPEEVFPENDQTGAA
jgi:transcriptional regulator with XRE-family HTH domain